MKNFDLKTALVVLGFIISGIVAFYTSRLAVADEITSLRITDATIQTRVDNGLDDIVELKEQISQLNAKVDILLIDRGYNPKKVVNQNATNN